MTIKKKESKIKSGGETMPREKLYMTPKRGFKEYGGYAVLHLLGAGFTLDLNKSQTIVICKLIRMLNTRKEFSLVIEPRNKRYWIYWAAYKAQ